MSFFPPDSVFAQEAKRRETNAVRYARSNLFEHKPVEGKQAAHEVVASRDDLEYVFDLLNEIEGHLGRDDRQGLDSLQTARSVVGRYI